MCKPKRNNLFLDHFVVGGGGKDLHPKDETHVQENEQLGMKLHSFGHHLGFGYFAISKDKITAQLINAETDDLESYDFVRPKNT